MTDEQKRHVAGVINATAAEILEKYERGQREHGGNLWRKPQAANLVEEALDQVVYAMTLRGQHRELRRLAMEGSEADLRDAVMRYTEP